MTKLSIVVIFLLSLCSIAYGHPYALSYDNKPITAKSWEEVDISWYNPLNHKIPNTAKLLRPIDYANKRGLVVGGHVHMKLGEFGVPNAQITVTAVKPLSQKRAYSIHHLPNGDKPIIGVYIHQTNDVRTYTFKDAKGKLSILHATPVHPFYVKNLHVYLPISKVTNSMQLVGKNNEIIHLLCPKHKHVHCGIPYHKGKITTVYNIEVYQKHFYRVGNHAIKVHNGPCDPVSPDEIIRRFENKYPNGTCQMATMCMLAARSRSFNEQQLAELFTDIDSNITNISNGATGFVSRRVVVTHPNGNPTYFSSNMPEAERIFRKYFNAISDYRADNWKIASHAFDDIAPQMKEGKYIIGVTGGRGSHIAYVEITKLAGLSPIIKASGSMRLNESAQYSFRTENIVLLSSNGWSNIVNLFKIMD